MSNYLRNEGPLPEAALDTLAWINGKDAEIERLREALEEIARLGVSFDAKGTRSKQVNEIARRALGRPA